MGLGLGALGIDQDQPFAVVGGLLSIICAYVVMGWNRKRRKD